MPSASPPGAAGIPTAPERTRSRNVAPGLCLDIRDEPRDGSGTRLADCSSAWTQQWTYEDDGLLRSVADPGLCLDSRKDAGVVVPGACADPGDPRGADVRYDPTAQGELVPRWDVRLALTPAAPDANADIVVETRDRTVDQRWIPEPVRTDTASPPVSGADTSPARHAKPAEPVM